MLQVEPHIGKSGVMAANAENRENPVVEKEQDENNAARVSSEQNVFPVRKVSEELDSVIREIRELPCEVESELAEARIAGKYRNQMRKVLEDQVNRASERLERLKASATGHKLFGHEIFQTLYDKGIESAQDWREYVNTTEHDGELIAEICEMFQTDVKHIRGVLKAVQSSRTWTTRQAERKQSEEKMDVEEISGQLSGTSSRDDYALNRGSIQIQMVEASTSRQQTGALCEPRSRQPSARLERSDTTAGQDALNFMAWVQTNACVGPGVFRGNKSENLDEFIRRFKRKYGVVGFDDQTLLEILIDDHLEGRAKSVVLALPMSVREQGFEAVVEELRKILTHDSTAGRLRALTELRCLKRRIGQSVADFCGVLEDLGRQAYPSCSIKDRSLEYAQILLDNLADWPEHIQLLTTLHGVDPSEAYDSVKQLALTMEQSRALWAPIGSTCRDGWRKRSAAYHQVERKREQEFWGSEDIAHYERKKGPREESSESGLRYPRQNELGGSGNAVASRGERPRQGDYSEHRRCYNCQRIGHIGRDCPLKKPQVNQIADKPLKGNTSPLERAGKKEADRERQRISSIISCARSLGVKCELTESAETPLVGRTVSVKARLLNMSMPAILDTGSMVSIMPEGVLARAQKTGFDVDSLEVIPKGSMVPVLDASGNSMTFLGAVKAKVELEGGDRAEVAFHISDVKEGEILLGTNALKEVGVQVVLTRRGSEVRNKDLERVPNDGIPRYMMDKSKRGYKTQLLQAVAEVHNKEKEFNVGKRGKVKHEYDCRHKVGQRKPSKTEDSVYRLSPKRRAGYSRPRLTGERAGPSRVRETRENSSVITRDGEITEPVRVRRKMRKRGRKPCVKVQKITCASFRGAEIRSKSDKGQFFRSSGTRIENGRICCDVGTPESAVPFYGSDCTVSCAKMLYETIRKRVATSIPLPELKRQEFVSMRTSTNPGGGMWHEGGRNRTDRSLGDRPPKRRSFGGNC